jgi:hypothetical protein
MIAVYLFGYLLISAAISSRLLKGGSDNFFYEYYTELIRINNHQSILSFPNFTHYTPVCDPQYIYKILSYFSRPAMKQVAIWLNPVVMTVTLLFVYLGLMASNVSSQYAFLTVLLTSLVPQYYYLNNSRLSGLSGRGIGIMLYTLLGIIAMNLQTHENLFFYLLPIGTIIAWLIVGSSIFAFQALIITSFAFLLLFRDPWIFVMLLSGILLFIFINKNYALHYLKQLFLYWRLYKTVLANRFILAYRPSIYRDFISDFFIKYKKNKAEFIKYAYGNSILILLFLTPTSVAAILFIIHYNSIYQLNIQVLFAIKIAITSLLAFYITSLKYFRFWGEPERYIELATPFFIYFIVIQTFAAQNSKLLWVIAIYFVLTNILQFLYSIIPQWIKRRTDRSIKRSSFSRENIIKNINATAYNKNGVTIISNNLNLIKILLNTQWRFVYYWPSTDNFDGYKFEECFEKFPYLNTTIMTKLAIKHHASHILFDASAGETEPDEILSQYNLTYCDDSIRLWALRA